MKQNGFLKNTMHLIIRQLLFLLYYFDRSSRLFSKENVTLFDWLDKWWIIICMYIMS